MTVTDQGSELRPGVLAGPTPSAGRVPVTSGNGPRQAPGINLKVEVPT